MATSAQAALDVRRQNGGVAKSTLADDIRKMRAEFQVAMPKGAEAEQLIRDALTLLRRTPKLAECDSASVLGSLMTCAQLGLRVGVLGQAWVLPFWDRRSNGFQAQLIIGYQGYSELAHRSPKVQSFIPRTVHANDDFDVDYGVTGTLTHKPAQAGPRGPAIGFHSIARYNNGGYDFFYMSKAEMEEHRDRFATTKTKAGVVFGPWVDHFEAMGMKTTQRLLAKYIPKSPELMVAVEVDGGFRIDLNPRNPAEEVTLHPEIDNVVDAETVAADGPIQDGQRKRLMALSTQVGWKDDRDARMAYINQQIDRQVTSSNELTAAEAAKVCEALSRFAEQEAGPSNGR